MGDRDMKNLLKYWARKMMGIRKPLPVVVKATFIEKPYCYGDGTLTLTFDDGTTEDFFGSLTIWHRLPMMDRLSTSEEFKLYAIYKYIRHYGNDWPTAHEKTETNV
jgi:hypothetical protein